jgi:glycine cleavage system aminomethyltransferase T
MKITARQDRNKEAGWITSATRSERLEKTIALGFVKRGFNSIGTKLNAVAPDNAETAPVEIEVVLLPFK